MKTFLTLTAAVCTLAAASCVDVHKTEMTPATTTTTTHERVVETPVGEASTTVTRRY